MKKSEFIGNAVKILYSTMVQITIAIENYTNSTIIQFNPQVLNYFDEWCEAYDNSMRFSKEKNWGEDLCDAKLIFYLRNLKADGIKKALSYIETNIIQKSGIDYNIKRKYNNYENSNEENPFEKIMIDIRGLEDEKTEDIIKENNQNQEDKKMEGIKNVVWFNEGELKLLNKDREIPMNQDGELGGHLSYPRISTDMSYLLNEEERKRIFNRCILGVTSDVE